MGIRYQEDKAKEICRKIFTLPVLLGMTGSNAEFARFISQIKEKKRAQRAVGRTYMAKHLERVLSEPTPLVDAKPESFEGGIITDQKYFENNTNFSVRIMLKGKKPTEPEIERVGECEATKEHPEPLKPSLMRQRPHS